MQTNLLDGAHLVAVTRNVGKVSSEGFEAKPTWPTPMDGLLLNAKFGYLDQTVDEYPFQNADGTFTNKASTTELGYATE
ncbi:MAG: hypothetical protein P8O79_03110 [Halieaceae bacterium]|nr:hypothetical protein [Halieaceae bacterium]